MRDALRGFELSPAQLKRVMETLSRDEPDPADVVEVRTIARVEACAQTGDTAWAPKGGMGGKGGKGGKFPKGQGELVDSRVCYHCHKMGHIAAKCPKKVRGRGKGGPGMNVRPVSSPSMGMDLPFYYQNQSFMQAKALEAAQQAARYGAGQHINLTLNIPPPSMGQQPAWHFA